METDPIDSDMLFPIDINTENENIMKINIDSDQNSYTGGHNLFDFKLHNLYIQSNSPLTMSENNSIDSDNDEGLSEVGGEGLGLREVGGEGVSNPVAEMELHPHRRRRHYDYDDIERSLLGYYDKDKYKYSKQLDILILFIKGQKNIYIQSKNLTQTKLYLFMLPALLITVAISIFAPIIGEYKWSGGVISGLNFIVTSCITIMNYMRYESKTDCYNQIAVQYDKIESSLELMNTKLFFVKKEEEKRELVLNKILETEVRLSEIKDIYTLMIPSEMKLLFPVISHTNIFSFIKKIENQKHDLIIYLMNTKNEIDYILHKWKKTTVNNTELSRIKEKNRLLYLYDIKAKIKEDILQYNRVFQNLEADFLNEICHTEKISTLWILFCLPFRMNTDKADSGAVELGKL
jgi:hypothetical protein